MGDQHANQPGGDLHQDVERGIAGADLAADQERERHRRVEMGAGDRPEDQDQHGQDGAGRHGVAQQRERRVPAG